MGALEETQIPEIEKKFLRDEGDKDLKPKPFESVGGYQETVIRIPNIPDLIVVSHGDYVRKKEEFTGLESVKFNEGQNISDPLPNIPPYIALRYCIKLV
ncbi:hypothetical protein [Rhizobium rhizosphaerae]|uniref:hypothetical protein n=1 Tax=Xaviernesmea rhizosphaerae TaxID=1672749 RepID=UPI00117A7FBA|nr:hypothetical protein [Xaviernesmea rhizosphaerae]